MHIISYHLSSVICHIPRMMLLTCLVNGGSSDQPASESCLAKPVVVKSTGLAKQLKYFIFLLTKAMFATIDRSINYLEVERLSEIALYNVVI